MTRFDYVQPNKLKRKVVRLIEAGKLTVAEAAFFSRVSLPTVHRWVREVEVDVKLGRYKLAKRIWENAQ